MELRRLETCNAFDMGRRLSVNVRRLVGAVSSVPVVSRLLGGYGGGVGLYAVEDFDFDCVFVAGHGVEDAGPGVVGDLIEVRDGVLLDAAGVGTGGDGEIAVGEDAGAGGFFDIEVDVVLLHKVVAVGDGEVLPLAADHFGDGDRVPLWVALLCGPGALEFRQFGIFDFVVGAGGGGADEGEDQRKSEERLHCVSPFLAELNCGAG